MRNLLQKEFKNNYYIFLHTLLNIVMNVSYIFSMKKLF